MSSLPPNHELVAQGWLAGVVDVPTGTILPEDNSTWAASGFVQVGAHVGGSPEMYVPIRRPVVQIDCWAVAAGSRRPPWGMANWLAELVVAATYVGGGYRVVTLPVTGYQQALVHGAWPLTEPRRMPSDMANYARFSFDLALAWTAVPG